MEDAIRKDLHLYARNQEDVPVIALSGGGRGGQQVVE